MAAVTLAHDPGLLASGVQRGVFRSQGHGRNHLGLGHGSEEMVRRVYAHLGAGEVAALPGYVWLELPGKVLHVAEREVEFRGQTG